MVSPSVSRCFRLSLLLLGLGTAGSQAADSFNVIFSNPQDATVAFPVTVRAMTGAATDTAYTGPVTLFSAAAGSGFVSVSQTEAWAGGANGDGYAVFSIMFNTGGDGQDITVQDSAAATIQGQGFVDVKGFTTQFFVSDAGGNLNEDLNTALRGDTWTALPVGPASVLTFPSTIFSGSGSGAGATVLSHVLLMLGPGIAQQMAMQVVYDYDGDLVPPYAPQPTDGTEDFSNFTVFADSLPHLYSGSSLGFAPSNLFTNGRIILRLWRTAAAPNTIMVKSAGFVGGTEDDVSWMEVPYSGANVIRDTGALLPSNVLTGATPVTFVYTLDNTSAQDSTQALITLPASNSFSPVVPATPVSLISVLGTQPPGAAITIVQPGASVDGSLNVDFGAGGVTLLAGNSGSVTFSMKIPAGVASKTSGLFSSKTRKNGILYTTGGSLNQALNILPPASAPVSLTGQPSNTGSGGGQVQLSWNSNSPGEAVTAYVLLQGGSPAVTVASSPSLITGLTNGVAYSFTVRARNPVSTSGDSSPVTVTPYSDPAAPGSPLALANGNNSVALSWTASVPGTYPVTGYSVIRTAPGAPVTFPTASLSYTDGTATNNVQNIYVIRAKDSQGHPAGPASSPVTAIPPVNPPSQLLASAVNPTSVDLVWAPSVNNSAAVTAYRVERDIGAGFSLLTTVAAPATVYTDPTLLPGDAVTYRVRADNGLVSAPSTILSVQTSPSAPASVWAVARNNSADLFWVANPGAESVTTYNIYKALGLSVSLTLSGTFNSGLVSPATVGQLQPGLINGTSYVFGLRSVRKGVESADSMYVTVVPIPPPGAPQNPDSDDQPSQILVSWNASPASEFVYQYEVSRAIGAGAFSAAMTLASPVTSWLDSGLVNGTTYRYSVLARNTAGVSPASVTVTGIPDNPPSVPPGLSTKDASGAVSVFWSPGSAGSDGLGGYAIYAKLSGAASFTGPAATYGAGVTAGLVGGLTNGSTYDLEVRALDTVYNGTTIDGDLAHQSAPTTQAQAYPSLPPAALAGFSSVSGGNGSATLTWNVPAISFSGRFPYDGFAVFDRISGGTYDFSNPTTIWTAAQGASTTIGASVTFTLGGLTNGSTYFFQVHTIDQKYTVRGPPFPQAAHESSNTTEGKAFPAIPPTTPGGLSLRDLSAGVSVWWSASTATSYPLKGYWVYRRLLPAGSFSVAATVLAPATNVTLAGMAATVSYALQVTAYDDNTFFDPSLAPHESAPAGPVTSSPAPNLGAPQSLAVAENSNSVTLTWAAPVSVAGNRPLAGYLLYRRTNGTNPNPYADAVFASVSVLSSPVTYIDAGLTPGTTYTYVVSSIDNVRLGLWKPEPAHEAPSAPVTGVPALPPSTPPNVRVLSTSASAVSLIWDPATPGTLPLGAYDIHRSIASGQPFTLYASVGGAQTVFGDAGVTPNATYYYKVRARDNSGLFTALHVSAPSPDLMGVAADLPGAPGALTAIPGADSTYGMTATEIRLTWLGATSTGLPVNSYNVYRSTLPNDPSPVFVTNTSHLGAGQPHAVQDSGLVPAAVYYYWVRSVDAAGRQSAQAPPVPVQPADPPGPPTGVTTLDSPASVQVSWTAPASAGDLGPVSEYIVFKKLEPLGSPTAAATVVYPGTSAGIAGLTDGNTYSFRVVALVNQDPVFGGVFRAGNPSALTSTALGYPALPPNVPVIVRTVAGDTAIYLEWNSVAQTYPRAAHRLYRDGSYLATVTQPFSANPSYTDIGLVNGTSYAYTIETYDVVKGSDPAHLSGLSTPVTLIPSALGLVPPSGLTGNSGNNSVTLVWNSIPTADSYDIFYGTLPNPSAYASPVTGLLSPAATVGALVNGTLYHFQVRQVEAGIPSLVSADVGVYAGFPPSPPATIGGLSGDNRVDLAWSTVVPGPGQLSLLGYNVYRISGGVTVALNGSPLVPTTFTDYSALNGSSYSYYIESVDLNGRTSPPSSVTALFYPDTGPGAVPWLNGTAGNASAALNWGPATAGAIYPVGSYAVYLRTSSGSYGPAPVTSIASPALAMTVTSGLSNGTGYYFKVAALDIHGNKGPDSPESPLLWPGIPPPAPGSFTASPGNAQVDLFWVPSGSGGTYAPNGFEIWRGAGGPLTLIQVLTDPLQSDWLDTLGLVNGTTYTYVIYAVDSQGSSGNHRSAPASITGAAPQFAYINPPTGLAGTYVPATSSVVLTWIAPWGNIEVVDRFVITGSAAGPVTLTPSPVPAPGSAVTFTDVGVPDESTLTYKVKALTTLGSSSADTAPVTVDSTRQIQVKENEAYLSKNTFLPLKGETLTVEFGLGDATAVNAEITITVFSLSLEKVVDAKVTGIRGGDLYTWVWDGKDKNGDLAASGVYLVHVKSNTGNLRITRKVVLVK